MQQLIFIHIPKTAGVSVAKALKEAGTLLNEQGKNSPHKYGFAHKYLRDFVKDEHKSFPIVAVVRNPFDRIYSVFQFYQKKRKDIPKDLNFEKFVLTFQKTFLNKKPQFTDCFEYICDHTKTKIIANDILKFETIQTDFQMLSDKYGFVNKMQKENGNELKQTDINKQDLFTPEMKEVVETLFKRDIEHFQYTYEDFLKTGF